MAAFAARMVHAVLKELAKGRFFGEHAFIRIGDVVMIALLIPPDIRFHRGPPHQAGQLDKAGKAGFH